MGIASQKAKFRNLAATVQAVKAAAGVVTGVEVVNNQAAATFIQLFDKAAGSVVLGTDTPDLEYQVPANGSINIEIGDDNGTQFNTAISVAATTLEGGSVGSAAGVQAFIHYM